MPKAVDALPCGSRSSKRTFSPTAAKAVARLMAVVVLPTPPFWLAIAKIFGGELVDPEEDGVTIGHPGEGLGLNLPILHGLGELALPAFPFVEKANSGIGPMRRRPRKKLSQGRDGPRRHDIGLGGRRGLNPRHNDFWLVFQSHTAAGLAEESALSGIRFDQGDLEAWPQRRQDQPREAAAAAEVDQLLRGLRDQWEQLG